MGSTELRLLHTADWHLGRTLHEARLIEDQAHLLDQFVGLARDTRPDAILIAGDIYDRALPPADAVALLDEVLTRLVTDAAIPVIAIAGNHDGPERLEFGARVLAKGRLHLTGSFRGVPVPVTIDDRHGPVDIYPLPYADPPVVREALQQADIATHDAAMAAVMHALTAEPTSGRRSVLVAHAFVVGGAESESERALSVGGSGSVAASHFAGFDYVALGHLHRPQTIAGETSLRYPGSLLKYAFGEADHEKSVTMVEIDADGAVRLEPIALSPKRDLRVIEGPFDQLMAVAGETETGRDDYLLARLTDRGPILDAMPRLRTVYPNLLLIERPTLDWSGSQTTDRQDHRRIEALDLFDTFYRHVTGEALDSAERDAVVAGITGLARGQP